MVGRARSRLVAAARAAARWGLGRKAARPLTAIACAVHDALTARTPDGAVLRELHIVAHVDLAGRSGVLEPARPHAATPPQAWDTTCADAASAGTVTLPGRPLAWSVLEGVELNDTSLVRVGDALVGASGVMEDVDRGLRIKGPGIVDHRCDRVLVASARPVRTIPEGIRLCGFGSGNWYHWLVEILPTALAIGRLPAELQDVPLLVPEAVERSSAWREALDVVAPGRRTVTVPRTSTVAVDRLVWLDPAVNGPRTLRDDAPVGLDLLAPSLEILTALRTSVLSGLGIDARARPGRRVLLVRPQGAKRSANQDDLIAVARRRGFEPVDPGGLPFVEQVRLFAEAEVVAGGWGAAWSSMLFAGPETHGLMWAPRTFERWPLYSNLAPVSGMRLRHLWVDVDSRTMVGANKAPQHVPPDEFAAALDAVR